MTRIVLKNPTPVEQRYVMMDIHRLVCQHEREWRQIPELADMSHSRAKSRVTGLAWFYYCGQYAVDAITREFGVEEDTMLALMQVLGCKRMVSKIQRGRIR